MRVTQHLPHGGPVGPDTFQIAVQSLHPCPIKTHLSCVTYTIKTLFFVKESLQRSKVICMATHTVKGRFWHTGRWVQAIFLVGGTFFPRPLKSPPPSGVDRIFMGHLVKLLPGAESDHCREGVSSSEAGRMIK